MRGVRDQAARDRLVAALRRGLTVKAAAKAAGMGRQQAYRWRDRDPEVAELMSRDRRTGRARMTAPPTPAGASEDKQKVAGEQDPEFETKLRKLGLAALAQVARDPGHKDRVAAARYLVQLVDVGAEREPARRPSTTSAVPQPVTPGKAAQILRFGG